MVSHLKTEYSYNFIIAGWNVVKISESRRSRSVSSDSSVSDGSDSGAGDAGHHAQESGHHGAIPGVARIIMCHINIIYYLVSLVFFNGQCDQTFRNC